ncbi:hypothetical protein C2S52_012005 [Perilla frutescens var. hirtella]|nr:hypothetical protein C2S52_012005 [Perilla frutescens var. hirtella]KAH6785391.1 hypothetical protein C2S51_037846 [Perilla frutescens var. frutescens]
MRIHVHKSSDRQNLKLVELNKLDKAVGAAAERAERRNVFTRHPKEVTVQIAAHVLPTVMLDLLEPELLSATIKSMKEDSSPVAAAELSYGSEIDSDFSSKLEV